MRLRAAIREEMPALQAPDALRRRVLRAVREPSDASGVRDFVRTRATRWLALAASFVVVLAGGWWIGRDRAEASALADQVLASHVRSLMPGHLTDVRSSDQHTVKPWFNGKLDYSPPVSDFVQQGFPLLGGRLDYVGGRPVAVLVYGRRQHIINVFVWPTTTNGGSGEGSRSKQGYHQLYWTSADYTYWLVSDLNVDELRAFADLVRRG